jgi:hypothetical protein
MNRFKHFIITLGFIAVWILKVVMVSVAVFVFGFYMIYEGLSVMLEWLLKRIRKRWQ